jgi:limonene-1,2-epoxide hydrolase
MSTDNEGVVRAFLSAWGDRDGKRLGEFFAEGAVMQMMPRDPISGQAAIEEELTNQVAWATDFDLAVVAMASTGNAVLAERLDRFGMAGRTISVPVVGVFELDGDGKFTAWRDYFDWGRMMDQIEAAGIDTSAAATEPNTPPRAT